jgi:branched-chain amino acid transport system ATP-binding protein
VLRVESLSVAYGGARALSDVSLSVGAGQFVAIVGPNGAGKTTLFKAISGTVAPLSGRILYDGRDLATVPPAQRAHLGIAHVPEGRQVFKSMTVLENLEMGAYLPAGRAAWQRNLERILTLFPVLADRRAQLAGTLSGGEQQMVAIGRGLASSPKLLLLDEPSLGLAPIVVDELLGRIRALASEGVGVLLAEQSVARALGVAARVYALAQGRVVAQGSAAELRRSPILERAFLGADIALSSNDPSSQPEATR